MAGETEPGPTRSVVVHKIVVDLTKPTLNNRLDQATKELRRAQSLGSLFPDRVRPTRRSSISQNTRWVTEQDYNGRTEEPIEVAPQDVL